MAERNFEEELNQIKAEMNELQQQNAQLAHALKQLSDVVKKKMPASTFDGFVHNDIDHLAESIMRRKS